MHTYADCGSELRLALYVDAPSVDEGIKLDNLAAKRHSGRVHVEPIVCRINLIRLHKVSFCDTLRAWNRKIANS